MQFLKMLIIDNSAFKPRPPIFVDHPNRDNGILCDGALNRVGGPTSVRITLESFSFAIVQMPRWNKQQTNFVPDFQ